MLASALAASALSPPRPLTGVAFSGGGSRAYVAALGQLQALYEAGILCEIDHAAGVSGGAWAISVRACCNGSLAPIVDPVDLDWPVLQAVPPPTAAPHLAVCRTSIISAGAAAAARGRNLYEAWRAAVHETFLAPLGVDEHAGMERLAGGTTVSHIGVALLGRQADAPFALESRAFASLELNAKAAAVPAPRGSGEPKQRDAHGQGSAYSSASPCSTCSVARCSLADALAMSSFFPAAPLQVRRRAFNRSYSLGPVPLTETALPKMPQPSRLLLTWTSFEPRLGRRALRRTHSPASCWGDCAAR